MTAQAIHVLTLVFPDPSGPSAGDPHRVDNSSISFNYDLLQNIRTLSTNGPNGGNDITGLLYTPDLAQDDPCYNASLPYVPTNVTRPSSFPGTAQYALVALAPWISPTCTLSYLAAAREVQTQGFLFFMTNEDTAEPPLANDAYWSVGDGGDWKRDNDFPVYVLPGATGNTLINATADYSGNISSVPYGQQLLETEDPNDFVRLYVDLSTSQSGSQFSGSGTRLPSLWVFLLVVLAILLIIIGATSILMHWVQRRRRQRLRQRVVTGEVDLEVLGIKRLTVPQELLNKMPLYTYGTVRPDRDVNPSAPAGKDLSSGSASRSSSPGPDVRPTPAMVRAHSYRPTALDQPTCPICLDDFVAADPATNEPGNNVRELPCHHIFHPECVDAFLRDNSSLCPMCKKSCLPQGFAPKNITNAMVRRERIMRRNRERGRVDESQPTDPTADALGQDITPPAASHPPVSLSQRIARRITSAPAGAGSTNSQQMTDLSSTPQQRSATGAHPQPPPVPPADASRRREWARQRAVAMLGRRAPPLDPDAEEAARTPRWRKVIGSVFPGLGGR